VVYASVRGNLTAVIWKDKQAVHILMNMYRTSVGDNFCDEHGEVQ